MLEDQQTVERLCFCFFAIESNGKIPYLIGVPLYV